MSVPPSHLAVASPRGDGFVPEPALPRADEAAPVPLRRAHGRDRWGAMRRWPFGTVPTLISLVLHVAAVGAIVWALATPPEPEDIGAQVYAVLTQDLGDLEECRPLDMPEELPEIECVELPTIEIEPALEPEPCLEPLEEVAVQHAPSALSLSIVSKRVAPAEVAAVPTPPAPTQPVVVAPRPVPAAPPRAAPVQRPRGAMPRGRLRPIAKPIAYPDSARRAGIQGRARVAMTIDPQGSVVDAQLLASSGHTVLDQAALASARRWRFQPPGTFRRAAQTFRFSLN